LKKQAAELLSFEMLDSNRTVAEVYALNGQTQGFANTAAEVK
jgi:hypothetical protein